MGKNDRSNFFVSSYFINRIYEANKLKENTSGGCKYCRDYVAFGKDGADISTCSNKNPKEEAQKLNQQIKISSETHHQLSNELIALETKITSIQSNLLSLNSSLEVSNKNKTELEENLLKNVQNIGFSTIEDMSLFDSLYMTIITISTVGFEEVKPLSIQGRIFTLLIISFGISPSVYQADL